MTDVLRFDIEARTRLLIPMELDIDPTDSTVELKVDDNWYLAEWVDTPVRVRNHWECTARTTSYFAGPDVALGGDIVLTKGPHRTKSKVEKAGDVLVARSTTVAVVSNA